ncbi:unnamed protein product [Caenorhabditis angaria]|uniref:Uncharacterized protein n=1 Tax=Caenorhabditis angaria TaxID=860376 RepID=A0A9P1IAX9_9PELO|nr:unnamed protein product [Caenorhabditis angaria]
MSEKDKPSSCWMAHSPNMLLRAGLTKLKSLLPKFSFNMAIQANFSIESQSSKDVKEVQKRCERILELEREIETLKYKNYEYK